jgi:hypothetical protein
MNEQKEETLNDIEKGYGLHAGSPSYMLALDLIEDGSVRFKEYNAPIYYFELTEKGKRERR